MKLNKLSLGIALMSFCFILPMKGISQQSNVVSAALEYKKFQPALMKQDTKGAKKHLTDAKGYIDAAMNHESTANDSKAHYYNVLINMGLMSFSAMQPDDEDLKVYQNDSIRDVLTNSIEITNKTKRWKRELEDYFNQQSSQAIFMGEAAFKAKNYEMAFAAFAGVYELKRMAGISEDRENMKTNAIVSALNYIDTLDRSGKKDDAMEFVSGALKMFPESERIAISGVNLALENNDLEKAEEYFNFAAEAAPKNKELFANMGSIYLTEADKEATELRNMDVTNPDYAKKSDLVEDLYAKSELNLKKALDIDANYSVALYNLGVLYLGQGEKFKSIVGQMDYNDPRLEQMQEKTTEMYTKAIDPLEKYIKQDPDNVGVLNVLFQVHRNAGNDEKAMEYRRKAQELRGE